MGEIIKEERKVEIRKGKIVVMMSTEEMFDPQDFIQAMERNDHIIEDMNYKIKAQEDINKQLNPFKAKAIELRDAEIENGKLEREKALKAESNRKNDQKKTEQDENPAP